MDRLNCRDVEHEHCHSDCGRRHADALGASQSAPSARGPAAFNACARNGARIAARQTSGRGQRERGRHPARGCCARYRLRRATSTAGHRSCVAVRTVPSQSRVANPCVIWRCAAYLRRNVETVDSGGRFKPLRDSAGCVLRIVEDRDANGAERAVDEINTGIVSIPAGRAAGWLAALNTHNAQGERYLTDTVECAVADGVEIVTVQPEDRWEIFGVNSQAQRTQLERIVQRNIAHALLNDGVRLADAARIDVRGALKCGRDVSIDVNCVFEGRVVLGDGVCIGPNCVLKNAVIDAGAVIRAFTHIEEANIGARSVIGPYARLRPGAALDAEVHIGNFVEVKSAHLKQGAKVNHLSYIGDADIGARVNLGAGAITCNYDGARKHRTVIEDDVFIGSDTQLVAPVRVARGATIAAGTTVWKDVPERALALNEKTQIARLGYRRPEKSSKKDFK